MQLSKKSLKELRSILLEITPEVTVILDEFTAINQIRSNGQSDQDGQSEESAAERGISVIKEFIDMLLVRQYDRIVKILSVLHGVTPKKFEEKPLSDVITMVEETLSDEALVRFFPQLRLLKQKT